MKTILEYQNKCTFRVIKTFNRFLFLWPLFTEDKMLLVPQTEAIGLEQNAQFSKVVKFNSSF